MSYVDLAFLWKRRWFVITMILGFALMSAPTPQGLSHEGQIVFHAASASEPPGKKISDIKTVPVHLTFHDRNDIEILSEEGTSALRKHKVIRMANEALDQGGLLTQEDLAVLLCSSSSAGWLGGWGVIVADVLVMASLDPGTGVDRTLGRRKDPLPRPLRGRVGIFDVQRLRKHDPAESVGQIFQVHSSDLFEMRAQRLTGGLREHGNPVLVPLAITNDDLLAVEVEVLHPQSQAVEKAQTRTVE
mgnify:CR=1 FL=1